MDSKHSSSTTIAYDFIRAKLWNGSSDSDAVTLSSERNGAGGDAGRDEVADSDHEDKSPKQIGEGPVAEERTSRQRSRSNIAIVMSALGVAVFLAAVDTTIITTAVETISRDFKSSAGLTWIGSAYLLATAASTPIWGKISDIFGRRPILLIANVVFFIGSLLAAVSVNMGMFIASRAVQGVGGGGLLVMVNIAIGDMFTPRQRGAAYGMIGGIWALAGSLGPLIGGDFSEKVSWRWCFYVNLPLDGVAFIIIFLYVDLEKPHTPLLQGLAAIDWAGSFTIVTGTLIFLIGLQLGGTTLPWSSGTDVALITSGLFLIIFCFFPIERYFARYPLMPSRIFFPSIREHFRPHPHRLDSDSDSDTDTATATATDAQADPETNLVSTKQVNLRISLSNLSALAVCFFHGFAFVAANFFIPLYCQVVLQASQLQSGVYTLALSIPLSLSSVVAGFYVKKKGQYWGIIVVGLSLMLIAYSLFITLPSPDPRSSSSSSSSSSTIHPSIPPPPRLFPLLILAGLGTGLNFQAPLIALQTFLEPHDIATATSTFGFTRAMASALSVIVGGSLVGNEVLGSKVVKALGLGSTGGGEGVLFGGFEYANGSDSASGGNDNGGMQQLSGDTQRELRNVYASAMSKMWILYAVMVGCGLVCSLAIKRKSLVGIGNREEGRVGLEVWREVGGREEKDKKNDDDDEEEEEDDDEERKAVEKKNRKQQLSDMEEIGSEEYDVEETVEPQVASLKRFSGITMTRSTTETGTETGAETGEDEISRLGLEDGRHGSDHLHESTNRVKGETFDHDFDDTKYSNDNEKHDISARQHSAAAGATESDGERAAHRDKYKRIRRAERTYEGEERDREQEQEQDAEEMGRLISRLSESLNRRRASTSSSISSSSISSSSSSSSFAEFDLESGTATAERVTIIKPRHGPRSTHAPNPPSPTRPSRPSRPARPAQSAPGQRALPTFPARMVTYASSAIRRKVVPWDGFEQMLSLSRLGDEADGMVERYRLQQQQQQKEEEEEEEENEQC